MKCSVDNCETQMIARGWCPLHYGRWSRTGDPLLRVRSVNQGMMCIGDECDRPAIAKSLCQMHHQRLMSNGDPDVVRKGGENDYRWKGGRSITNNGYVYVWVDKKDPLHVMTKSKKNYALEHRLVMARSLGRPLEPHETVHHINGNKLDNRLDNLQLRSSNHGPGIATRCLDCGSSNVETTKL